MPFTLKIQNFGKLRDAEIRVAQFTVFAGPNDTGKSYVAKLLYSLLDGMSANHVATELNNLIKAIQSSLRSMDFFFLEYKKCQSIPMIRYPVKIKKTYIPALESIVQSCCTSEDKFNTFQNLLPSMIDVTRSMKATYHQLMEAFKPLSEATDNKQTARLQEKWGITKEDLAYIKENTEAIEIKLQQLSESIDALQESLKKSPMEFITSGIVSRIRWNLIQNFQVSSFSYLRNYPEGVSDVDIEGIGRLKFENDNDVFCDLSHAGLQRLQDYSKIIYLESPLYWKLKTPLQNAWGLQRLYRAYGGGRLAGVPSYFYDFLEALKEEYSGDIVFPELYEKLISKEVINGKITFSEIGEFQFQENGRSFPLSLKSMGVVNLAILALLIERKIVNKDSFVVINEPEAHLHTAWQAVMVETLFELAKRGANIVIATHSVDILKWLELHVKKNPEDEDLIALNHFSADGIKNEESDFFKKMTNIQQGLA